MEKKVIELFAGVGGFRVGLNKLQKSKYTSTGLIEDNGPWEFVWANQWEPSSKNQDAFRCYTTRFGSSISHSNVDITLVETSDIPDHSLLVGGFPCQDYSVAHSLSGEKGIEGKKGVLFWEIIRIAKEKNTPFLLLENVDRLLKSPSKQKGRDFSIMLKTLSSLGYNVEWRVINAADYSSPQRRRRIFVFAWKKNLKYDFFFRDNIDKNIENSFFNSLFPINRLELLSNQQINNLSDKTIEEVSDKETFKYLNFGYMLDGVIYTSDVRPLSENVNKLSGVIQNNVSSDFHLNKKQIEQFTFLKNGKTKKRTSFLNGIEFVYNFSEGKIDFPDSLQKPARTMLTSEATVNRSTHVIDTNDGNLRFITPVEAERLNDFPDDWTNTGMSLRKRYFMMGNALVTNIVSRMSERLLNIISNENN